MILTEYEWQTLLLSAQIACVAVLAILPFAIIIAWVLARCQFFGKSLFNAIIYLPLVLPPVVLGYLLLVTMGRRGIIGQFLLEHFNISFSLNWKGAAFAAAIVAMPLMVRAIQQAIESIDIRLESVAKTLGANSWRVFFSITIPLALPGIIVGIVLGIVRALGEFGATITFVSNIEGQTRTLPLAMYTLLQTPNSEHAVMRLCVISIGLSLIAMLISESLMQRYRRRLQG